MSTKSPNSKLDGSRNVSFGFRVEQERSSRRLGKIVVLHRGLRLKVILILFLKIPDVRLFEK